MDQDPARGKPWASQVQPSHARSPDYPQGLSGTESAAQHTSSAQGYADVSRGFHADPHGTQVLGRPASVSSFGGSSFLAPPFERGFSSAALPSNFTSSLVPYFTSAVQLSAGESSSGSWPYSPDQINSYTQSRAADHTVYTPYPPNTGLGYTRIGNANHQANAGPSGGPIRGTLQPQASRVSPLVPEEQAEAYAGVNPSVTLPGPSRSYADMLMPSPVSSTSNARSEEPESAGQARGSRHLACDFCRGRKLKCITDPPSERCRQCLRRGRTDCVVPPTPTETEEAAKTKGKRRRQATIEDTRGGGWKSHLSSSSSSTSSSRSIFVPPAQEQDKLSAAHSAAMETNPGVPSELNSQPSIHQKSSSLSPTDSRTDLLFASFGNAGEESHSESQQHDHLGAMAAEGTEHLGQVSREGPPEAVGGMPWPYHSNLVASPGPGPRVVSWGGDWWDRCLSTFGPRPRSVRIVEGLLRQFVVKHATLMSFFHKETFMDAMRRPEKRRLLHPAVVFAALAAAVCDLKVPRREEPFTADITAADTNAQRLAHTLRRISKEYIDVALMSGNGADDRLAQAASTLMLTETTPQGNQRLLSIVDSIVRGLEYQLPACAFKDPQKADVPDPSHPDYLELPDGQMTRDSEVSLELLLRICKTQISHFVRQILAKPDEDITSNQIPTFISTLRPFYIWEPSSLPKEDLPDSFFRSVQFTRMSSLLAKVFACAIRLDATLFSVDDPVAYAEVLSHHRDLSILESGLRWLGGQKDQDATAILPVQAQQMFVKIHVFTRVSLYRKTGIWLIVEDEDGALPPSLVWWLSMFTQTIRDLRLDADSCFASGSFELKSSTAEIEAALRQVKIAVQILEVLSYTHADIEQLLREGLDTLQVQVSLRPGCVTPDGLPLLNILDDVQGAFHAFSRRKTNNLLSGSGLVPAQT